MKYRGKSIIKNCLLCKNYQQHPCECTHCADMTNFKISEDGKFLYAAVFEQGYQCKCEEDVSEILGK